MKTLSEYNNNPGNLRPPKGVVYDGQIGVDDKGFAIFENPEFGQKALINDISHKMKSGVDTPDKFVNRFAPAGEENSEEARENYKIHLMMALGLNSTNDPFPKDAADRIAKAVSSFEGGTWNQPQEPQEAQPAAEPTSTEEQYQGKPIANAPSEAEKNRSALEAGAMGAGVGTLGGSIYTAKAPIFRMAQRVGLLPGGKPIAPAEAAALAERVMTPSGEPVESVVRKPHGGENWQKALTGISTPGAQMDKASLDLAKRMQGAVGIEGAPGFTGGTITQGGVILSPQDAAAVKARADAAAAQAAQREAQFQSLVRQAGQSDALQRGARTILGSAPVRGGLAGFGAGYSAQEAYNRFDEGDPLAGTLSAGAAGASGLSLVPRLAARAVPAAVGLTAASDVASKLRKGDRQGAAESGLTGLAAVAPRVFGPAATAVYSRSLGPDEMAELERRRKMRPTITP